MKLLYIYLGAEGAEKILGYVTCIFQIFLHFPEVSVNKIDQNKCAEGALIVKHTFQGFKMRNDSRYRKKLA